MNQLMRRFAVGALVGAAACSSSGGGTPADGVERVRLDLLAIVSKDARLSGTTALAPDDYEALAQQFATVANVEADDYVGDTLGTIYIKVRGGGVLLYRHITNDSLEAATLPAEADFANQLHPTRQSNWSKATATPLSQPLTASNTYATHFPVASADPDPEYTADQAVTCPQEGKIAIVDFLWTEAHRDFPGLYDSQYMVDGVMLYDRIDRIAKASGFTLDVYKDDAINLGNFRKLQDYAIVFTNGHGGRPGVNTTKRLGAALGSVLTAETYDPKRTTEFGMTYERAWTLGYLFYNVTDKKISWTPWLLRDFYKPSVPQLVMLNECWTMLPFNIGLDKRDGKWVWDQGVTGPLYNFGDALMDAGAKAVFGYVSPATPEAVVQNTMPFLRRMFGGYSDRDPPPSPHNYWPTCMGTQTYFRLPNTPQLAIYGNKYRARSMYTMYAVSENLLLREECPGTVPHALLQDFMLQVGTPATAFQICWDEWWSRGEYPSGIQDALCSKGDEPTTLERTNDAACAVKVARQVTNAILSP